MRASTKILNADFIKESITPLDFFQYELPDAKLTGRQWNNAGLCPFHSDNKPGSFFVNAQTGGFKCFSCGTSGGDIISFTMERYGLTFVEALQQLADDWGV